MDERQVRPGMAKLERVEHFTGVPPPRPASSDAGLITRRQKEVTKIRTPSRSCQEP